MGFYGFDLVFFAKVEKKKIELDQTEILGLGADIGVLSRPYKGVYDDIIWSGSAISYWS
jgi:hypothetical protein